MQTGELIYHFGHTILVTIVVAVCVLWRYRVGVLSGMGRSGAVPLPLPPLPDSVTESSARSSRAGVDVFHGEHSSGAEAVRGWMVSLQRRVTIAVAVVVGLCALPFGYAWMAGELPVTPAQVVMRSGGLLFVAVPMVAVLFGYSLRRILLLGARMLAVSAIGIVLLSMVQRVVTARVPTIDQFVNAYLFVRIVVEEFDTLIVLLLATGAPWVRGVAPIAFVGLLVFGVAPLLGQQITSALMTSRAGSDLVARWGLNAAFVVVAMPTGWLAWRRLSAVARAFADKRLAEGELLARVWWLMCVAEFAISYVNNRGLSWWPFALAGVMYAVFARSYRQALRLAIPIPRPPHRTLLLLRVLGDTARTERLYDRVGARWRWLGPITVIAAPDVVARTVDPGDFLEFVTGRLRRRFVKSQADLDARLRAIDFAPDPDGRYRVNELCCQDDTWRAAVVSLLDQADAVLMDLREFSQKREGCVFELQQLALRVAAKRVVIIMDETTDREVVRTHLGELRPVVVETPRGRVRDRDMDRVFDAVVGAAYAA